MHFTFPENKAIFQNVIQDFYVRKDGYIDYTYIDILKPLDNLITIDNRDYFFTYLSSDSGRNKGGNSIILKLFSSQNVDPDDVEYGDPDLILKILRFRNSKSAKYKLKPEKRFEKEIKALRDCNVKQFQNVITIFHDGICKIYNPKNRSYDEYTYYTMEPAEYDLKSYIEAFSSTITFDEKVALCLSLSRGLQELRSLGYYHRDIKPDNIFIVGKDWKIGDLGLVNEQNEINQIDYVAEAIGPKGWMSPESMNKYLTEKKGFPNTFDCTIDHQSDIFQLGKVFWYIFQHNAPIGCVKESDFKIKGNSRVYPILRTMLNYSKKKRYKEIGEVIQLLKPIEEATLKAS